MNYIDKNAINNLKEIYKTHKDVNHRIEFSFNNHKCYLNLMWFQNHNSETLECFFMKISFDDNFENRKELWYFLYTDNPNIDFLNPENEIPVSLLKLFTKNFLKNIKGSNTLIYKINNSLKTLESCNIENETIPSNNTNFIKSLYDNAPKKYISHLSSHKTSGSHNDRINLLSKKFNIPIKNLSILYDENKKHIVTTNDPKYKNSDLLRILQNENDFFNKIKRYLNK